MISDPENIIILLAGLFAAAALLISISPLLRRVQQQSMRELWQVYAFEFLIVAAVLLPSYLGPAYLLAALLLFSLRAHWEISKSSGAGFNIAFLANYLFSSMLFIAIVLLILQPYVVQILLLTIAALTSLLLHITGKKYQQQNWVLFVIVLSISCLLSIATLEKGFFQILFLYVITETNDSFAYLAGKLFGRKKLFPSISPKKTLEGLAGGVIVSMAAGIAFNYYFLDLSWWFALIVISLTVAAAVAGDLLFSMYKRRVGIKDFPAVIKSQGGVLDIYDSLLAASIVYYSLMLING